MALTLAGCSDLGVWKPKPGPADDRAAREVVLLIDTSASMRAYFPNRNGGDERRDGVAALIEELPERSHVTVIEFDDRARVLVPRTALVGTRGRAAALLPPRRLVDGGGTNFDAAVRLALSETSRGADLVLFTDGIGELTEATLEALREAEVRVHTIGLGPAVDRERLRGIAAKTRGRFLAVGSTDGLAEAFRAVLPRGVDGD